MNDKVLQIAKEQGLPTPRFVMKWKGYNVYVPDFQKGPDGEYPTIGVPQFILERGDLVRVTTYDEGFEILDALPDEE